MACASDEAYAMTPIHCAKCEIKYASTTLQIFKNFLNFLNLGNSSPLVVMEVSSAHINKPSVRHIQGLIFANG